MAHKYQPSATLPLVEIQTKAAVNHAQLLIVLSHPCHLPIHQNHCHQTKTIGAVAATDEHRQNIIPQLMVNTKPI